MPADGYETRTVVGLRTGSKVAVLCGVPLLGLAAYFYFVPLWVQGSSGVFGCGSASSPPTSEWAKGVCQGVSDAAMYKAILSGVLGILVPALGVALFGVDKRQERRDLDYDGHDDPDDAPRRSHRAFLHDDDLDEADRHGSERGPRTGAPSDVGQRPEGRSGRRRSRDRALDDHEADELYDDFDDPDFKPEAARAHRLSRARDEDPSVIGESREQVRRGRRSYEDLDEGGPDSFSTRRRPSSDDR